MKSTRRNFVVEYKTSRRQERQSPKSIWGDLDLRSLSRDVAMDQAGGPATLSKDGSRPDTSATEEGEAWSLPAGARILPAIAKVLEPIEPATPIALEPATPAEPSPSAEKVVDAPIEPRRATPRRPKPAPRVYASLPDERSVVAEQDDLIALEAENRRLKQLMAAKLRSENKTLLNMLRRF